MLLYVKNTHMVYTGIAVLYKRLLPVNYYMLRMYVIPM